MLTDVVKAVARFPLFIFHHVVHIECIQRIKYPKSIKCKLYVFVALLLSSVLLLLLMCLPSCTESCSSMCGMLNLQPLANNFYNRSGSGVTFAHTQRSLPGCLVIGVRKAGTRAILRYLNIHPDIVTESREMHFFDVNEEYGKGLEYYRKQLPPIQKHQMAIEKTPSYFTEPSVPERVYRMNSSIFLILVVRDPITRLISDYVQLKEKKIRNGEIPEPLEKEVFDSEGKIKTNYGPVKTSSYFTHFARWLEFFPQEQIYVADGELLITDPYKEMYKVETYLKLNHRITPDKFYFNDTKGFYCINDGNLSSNCMGETKGRQHPPVKQEYLDKLKVYFSQRNKMFFNMINRTFDWM